VGTRWVRDATGASANWSRRTFGSSVDVTWSAPFDRMPRAATQTNRGAGAAPCCEPHRLRRRARQSPAKRPAPSRRQPLSPRPSWPRPARREVPRRTRRGRRGPAADRPLRRRGQQRRARQATSLGADTTTFEVWGVDNGHLHAVTGEDGRRGGATRAADVGHRHMRVRAGNARTAAARRAGAPRRRRVQQRHVPLRRRGADLRHHGRGGAPRGDRGPLQDVTRDDPRVQAVPRDLHAARPRPEPHAQRWPSMPSAASSSSPE
jgi:hypothetical protein